MHQLINSSTVISPLNELTARHTNCMFRLLYTPPAEIRSILALVLDVTPRVLSQVKGIPVNAHRYSCFFNRFINFLGVKSVFSFLDNKCLKYAVQSPFSLSYLLFTLLILVHSGEQQRYKECSVSNLVLHTLHFRVYIICVAYDVYMSPQGTTHTTV